MKKRIVKTYPYRGGFSDQIAKEEQQRLQKRLDTVEVEKIRYESLDGLEVEGFVVRPKDFDGKLPCIIFNRGGNNEFGAINTSMLADWWARMANWGYVVIGSNYRGSHAQGKDEDGGADLGDVLALKDVLEELEGVDTSRIGMFGFSRGGTMAYLAMREVGWIDAVAVVGAPVDYAHQLKRRPEMRKVYERAFGATEEGMRKRSAIEWVDELAENTPILILHGEDDWRVDPQRTKDFVEKLTDVDIEHRFKIFKKSGHALKEVEDRCLGW